MIHYYDIMYNSVTMWWAQWWDINMISLGTNFNPVNMHLSSLIVTNHIYKQLFSRNCSLELRDRQVFSKFYKFLFETARLDYWSFYISGPDIFYIQIWRQKKTPFFLRNIWIRCIGFLMEELFLDLNCLYHIMEERTEVSYRQIHQKHTLIVNWH